MGCCYELRSTAISGSTHHQALECNWTILWELQEIDIGTCNDIVRGGSGNDTVLGGEGNDLVLGDGGDDSDTFVFGTSHGNDTITDFTDGEDTIDLSALTGITQFSDLTVTAEGNDVVISTGQGTIRLEGAEFNDIDEDDIVFYEAPSDPPMEGGQARRQAAEMTRTRVVVRTSSRGFTGTTPYGSMTSCTQSLMKY